MAPTDNQNWLALFFDKVGRYFVAGIEEIGNGGVLVVESFFWLIWAPAVNSRCGSARFSRR